MDEPTVYAKAMNTIIVCVILAYSQFCKNLDKHIWRKQGKRLYYILFTASLVIAIMKDLHLPMKLPAEWMNQWWGGLGQDIMRGD
ncbi:UNVERIFIED_CONTAM: hypothetical protein ABID98_004513 [Brevibacillus sp. OAP136]